MELGRTVKSVIEVRDSICKKRERANEREKCFQSFVRGCSVRNDFAL